MSSPIDEKVLEKKYLKMSLEELEKYNSELNKKVHEWSQLESIESAIIEPILEDKRDEKKSEIAQRLIKEYEEKQLFSPISNLIRNYEFYKIQEDKSNLYAIYNVKTSKIYLKNKEAFTEEIYNIALNYSEEENSIISDLYSKDQNIAESRKSNQNKLYTYLLENKGIKLIDNITFKPIKKKIVENEKGVFLNSYKPTKYLKEKFNNKNKEIKKFPYIHKLLLNLCANDVKAYEWFLKRLAYTIQRPEDKCPTYIVLQGEGASGKGTFFELVLEPIYQDYFLIGSDDLLTSNFNSITQKKLWVVIEEKEENKEKKSSIGSIIKLVTGSKKGVYESKGVDRREDENFSNYIFSTNDTTPGLNLKDSDRRATILGFSRALGGHRSKSPLVRLEMEKEIPKELDNFVSYLKNLEFDYREVFVSYETKARENIILTDMDNTELFIHDFKTSGDERFIPKLKELKLEKQHITIIYHNNKRWIWNQSVYLIYKKWSEQNEKKITGDSRFLTKFYAVTGLEAEEIKKEYVRKRYICFDDFLEYFKLTEEEDEANKSYIIEEIMEEVA